jgi:flavorubredoxin
MVGGERAKQPVTRLASVLDTMEPFHRRYMASNKVLRLWADMVATLPIDMIVPQHGAPLMDGAVPEFIDWVRTLACGIDLVGPDNYRVPAA